MASTDPEIKDGFNLPVWMKSKPAKEFEPFASSPPAHEDSFFYIRYPKTDALFGKTKFSADQKIESEQQKDLSATLDAVKDRDWSKHTKPCQDVLHGIAPINTASVKSINLKPKPAGTDDGFKGEGAACGSSVLKVAHQMISKGTPRGFTVASPDDEELTESLKFKLMKRRGSKSLPATPAHSPPSSPTSRRRMHANRYFTSPFEPVEDFGSRSWLSIALLGFKKDLAGSTSTLAEEETIENRLQAVSLAESVENLGPASKRDPSLITKESSTEQPKLVKPAHSFLPKPSELREMNFWSPTSM